MSKAFKGTVCQYGSHAYNDAATYITKPKIIVLEALYHMC